MRRSSIVTNAWSLGAALALGVCTAGAGVAAPLSADTQREVTALVDREMAEHKLPGVVVGVWMPGAAPWTLARGKADLATGRERAVGDPFRIASITKTFIGTAILTLVDAGKLKTTDKLARWYPDFPNAQQITVDDLLRMRSGIPDSADKAFLEEYYDKPFIALTPDDMIARSAARRAEFEPPNTVARYINTNFMILERIVEKVSGTDIQSYLARHVFGPLKLKGTLYPRGADLDSPLRGYSYEAASGTLVDRTRVNPIPAGGAGAIVSTLDDLHVYARALCRGKLLKPATQAARLVGTQLAGAPAILRYGEGVGTLGRFCGHNGTIFGFSTEMWYLPERDAVVVVNVNRLDKDDVSQSSEIFQKISRVLFPGLTDW